MISSKNKEIDWLKIEIKNLKQERGRWHDKFYIPDGETKTLSELREENYEREATFWGDAKDQFAKWYRENVLEEDLEL